MPFFITLCKTPGKPVNFVPVIDKDVRRWWRSDSLWQAHDARYTADQVCIIPGTQSVAGITRVDEPVGELLDRFEQASIDDVLASGAQPMPVVSRRQARADVTGPLAVVLDSPDVLWAGRTAINPVHRIGAPDEWQVNENRSATHPSTGARLELGADGVTLSVPLSDIWIDIPFTLPSCTVDGGMPVVTVEDASTAMRSVLAIAAGVDGPESLPPVHDDTVKVSVDWDPEKVADHTGVTATFGAPLAPGLTLVPDALVGLCWPAVFSAIGSAVTGDGFPVVEGLLSLVHLDHAAHLLAPMPKTAVRIVRHRNGFGGHRHRVRPGHPGQGDDHRRRRQPRWRPWRNGSRSAAAPAPPSSPIRRAPAGRSPITRPIRRVAVAAMSPSLLRPT